MKKIIFLTLAVSLLAVGLLIGCNKSGGNDSSNLLLLNSGSDKVTVTIPPGL
jgi:hypothetical protein